MKDSYLKDANALPPVLRALLHAELAAGNDIAEVGYTFPAPPAGAYFKLFQPLMTRAKKSADGIVYYDRNNSTYSGEITDAKRIYFLLEPPHPAKAQPTMDEIRAAHAPKPAPLRRSIAMPESTDEPNSDSQTPLTPTQCFEKSMIMNYDKWHDGIGYERLTNN